MVTLQPVNLVSTLNRSQDSFVTSELRAIFYFQNTGAHVRITLFKHDFHSQTFIFLLGFFTGEEFWRLEMTDVEIIYSVLSRGRV